MGAFFLIDKYMIDILIDILIYIMIDILIDKYNTICIENQIQISPVGVREHVPQEQIIHDVLSQALTG